MGYQTQYYLDIYPRNYSLYDLVVDSTEFNPHDTCKWYDRDHDMKTISAHNPSNLFILSGYGDDPDDLWSKAYFKGDIVWEWHWTGFPPVPSAILNPILSEIGKM